MQIAFLLGAGASKPFGISTTEDLAKEFLDEINDEDLNAIIVNEENRDIESLIKLIQEVKDLPQNKGLTFLELNNKWEDILTISKKFSLLEKKAYEFIRKKCLTPDIEKAKKVYQKILDLQSKTNIVIFSTNYDMIIEEVCRSMKIICKDGFKSDEHEYHKIFDPSSFNNSNIQLFKLHGSVNWWSDDSRQKIFNLSPEVLGFEKFNNLMIYPTEKDDIFNYPFYILHWFFNTILNQVDILFVIGHKFGDKNITASISAAIERPEFKLVIVNKNADEIKEKKFKTHQNVISINSGFEEWINNNGLDEFTNKLEIHNTTTKQNAELREIPKPEARVSNTTGYSFSNVPYAKHVPEAKGILFDLLDVMKDRQKCPECTTEFSVNKIYQIFNCPHCGIQLERQK